MNFEKTLVSLLLGTIAVSHLLTACLAEIVIQDVAWTKDYDEGSNYENYFGACRFVESPCGINNDCLCVQRGRCNKKGGIVVGDCQGGLGDCCQIVASWLENDTVVIVDQLVTYIASPSRMTTRCTFKLRKQLDICQVRLDFKIAALDSANADGVCESNWLRFSNSITVDRGFTTCGLLNNQHMYLTFGNEEYIEIMSKSNYFMILATMIPCRSKNRAPDHCLQYYTQPTGRVQSFNFGYQQLSNQRYSVCVKPNEDSESVQWKPCNATKPFDITTNNGTSPLPCDRDWVQVKGQNSVCEPFEEIKSVWKPYELLVNFDGSELPVTFNLPVDPAKCEAGCVRHAPAYNCSCIDNPSPINQICQCVSSQGGDIKNTGFCLDYTQL